MSTIYVTAAPGSRVPQENHPRRYYPAHDAPAMVAADTPHLRRLIALGDLVLIAGVDQAAQPDAALAAGAADVEVQ